MSESTLRDEATLREHLSQSVVEPVVVHEVDMRGVNLVNETLEEITFRRVEMGTASLDDAHLRRVHISQCGLREASFGGSSLQGCTLYDSQMMEVSFHQAKLDSVQMVNCRLGNADFSNAHVIDCSWTSCELFASRWTESLLWNLRFDAPERGNIPLDRADFSGAIIVNADLMGASLLGANFEHAVLIGVDLRHANLAQARFKGAHFVNVQYTQEALEPGQQRAIDEASAGDARLRSERMQRLLKRRNPDDLAVLSEALLLGQLGQAYRQDHATSFPSLITELQARHDFPELSRMRVTDAGVEVQCDQRWHPLTARVEETNAPQRSQAQGPMAERRDDEKTSPIGSTPEIATPKADPPTPRSKRFENLELD